MDFQPILLGTETGVYGSARAIHEAYGISSLAYGRIALTATKYSSIVTTQIQANFNDPEVFLQAMKEHGRALKKAHPDTVYVLIPGGDDYSMLLSRYRDELSAYFSFNVVNYELHKLLSTKTSFYDLCDKYRLPHPATFILDADGARNKKHYHLPFGYPVALKPADSVQWNRINFEGRKKAYCLNNPKELDDVVTKIYGAGYTAEIIIQDFIPGNDDCMRVLNIYVDQNHHVRSMIVGQIVLADPTPYAIGNYSAIIPTNDEAICKQIASFLREIGYQGFANFDIKYDPRDGQDKIFEINLRPGRTAYFATENGLNVGRCYIDDLVYNTDYEKTNILQGNKMLLEVPPKTLRRYSAPSDAAKRALALLGEGSYEWTLRYSQDLSLRRRAVLHRLARLAQHNFEAYGIPQGKEIEGHHE